LAKNHKTSVCDVTHGVSVVGVAGWPVIQTGWPAAGDVVEVGVVDTRLAAATLSGRGARVYTYACVYDNIPCRSLPK